MISAQRIVPPSVEPVTLEQAKAQCRISGDEDDLILITYIQAARERAEKQMARAILAQTWLVSFDRFPSRALWRICSANSWSPNPFRHHDQTIPLPWPKLISIVSITYLDTNGNRQTLPAEDYEFDLYSEPARVSLAPGYFWPATLCGRSDAVQITLTAGYGTTPDTVPASVQLAILGLVAHWYENRESVVLTNSPNAVTTLPQFVEDLLADEAAPAVFSFEV